MKKGEKMADRLISADKLLHSIDYQFERLQIFRNGDETLEQIGDILHAGLLQEIANAPTVDAEPVVRCKDCKHSFGELSTRGGVWSTDAKHLFCNMTKHLMRVDDFCSWGERREDG